MTTDTTSDGPGHRPVADADHAIILRDYLALERTRLANERTLLAYTRTALMLFVSGVTLIKVFEQIPALVVMVSVASRRLARRVSRCVPLFAQVRRRIAAGG
jgi:uncharacterized membrane protein YidH (DUF202 family)